MKAAVDTNIFVYFEEQSPRGARARALLQIIDPDRVVIPVQVAGELFNVLTRKTRMGARAAQRTVERWTGSFQVGETTGKGFAIALDLAAVHKLQIWDAIILTVADEADCELLLTEDLKDGFHWRGVTVVDPFATARSPLLDRFLGQTRG